LVKGINNEFDNSKTSTEMTIAARTTLKRPVTRRKKTEPFIAFLRIQQPKLHHPISKDILLALIFPLGVCTSNCETRKGPLVPHVPQKQGKKKAGREGETKKGKKKKPRTKAEWLQEIAAVMSNVRRSGQAKGWCWI